jgi:type VI protein secretion system component VasF
MKRPAKAIAMLASMAVLACSIFVVSWIGIAWLLMVVADGILKPVGEVNRSDVDVAHLLPAGSA